LGYTDQRSDGDTERLARVLARPLPAEVTQTNDPMGILKEDKASPPRLPFGVVTQTNDPMGILKVEADVG